MLEEFELTVANASALFILSKLEQFVTGRLNDGKFNWFPEVSVLSFEIKLLKYPSSMIYNLPKEIAILEVS